MEKEIIFVTTNKGKVASAKKVLGENNFLLKDYDFEIVEPDVNDIEFIATYKVKTAYEKIKKPCISLDAGFYIPNFPNNPNFPGAFPKRELINKIGIDGLLEKMKNVKNRECYFKDCLAYYDGKQLKLFYGYSHGTLATKACVTKTDKRWSDLWCVFIPDNCTKTLAEMTEEELSKRNDYHSSPFANFCAWLKKEGL